MVVILEHFNYILIIIMLMAGLYVIYANHNLIKKLVGLALFQTSVNLFYISMGKITGGVPPILTEADMQAQNGQLETVYSNPLPHVLILTAIVVGVATLALGLSIVVRIREAYGTIEENEIDAIEYEHNLEGVKG